MTRIAFPILDQALNHEFTEVVGEPRDWQITIRYQNRRFLYFVYMNINIYTAVFKSVLIWKYKLNIYIPFLFSSKRCWQNEFRGSFQKESTIAAVKISQSLCFPFARYFQSLQASICLDVLYRTSYQINEGKKKGSTIQLWSSRQEFQLNTCIYNGFLRIKYYVFRE